MTFFAPPSKNPQIQTAPVRPRGARMAGLMTPLFGGAGNRFAVNFSFVENDIMKLV